MPKSPTSKTCQLFDLFKNKLKDSILTFAYRKAATKSCVRSSSSAVVSVSRSACILAIHWRNSKDLNLLITPSYNLIRINYLFHLSIRCL